uniref:Profilin n=1 Tax=Parascaris univalens TaxID=6257 RepID=A0A915C6Q2_PARUN
MIWRKCNPRKYCQIADRMSDDFVFIILSSLFLFMRIVLLSSHLAGTHIIVVHVRSRMLPTSRCFSSSIRSDRIVCRRHSLL